MSLARDALSSGYIVAAESYLQHAEHYNRIVMAAQPQASPQSAQPADQANGGGRPQQNAEAGGGENSEPNAGDAGTGSQDRERHAGSREHHGGRGRGRQSENRNEGVNDANGAEPEKAQAPDESETVSDTVS